MATFFMHDAFSIAGVGVIVVGQVRGDVLRVRMKVNVGGKIMEVKIIKMAHKQVAEAKSGDNVGVMLVDADYNILKNYKGRALEFL